MGEHDDEELQRAFRMSLQPAPDAKRSRPRDFVGFQSSPDGVPASLPQAAESNEIRERQVQRELRAAAAERRRIMALETRSASSSVSPEKGDADVGVQVAAALEERAVVKSPAELQDTVMGGAVQSSPEKAVRGKRRVEDERQQLPNRVAEQLHTMVFGTRASPQVLAQWCNQGFRFSRDPETSLGLVQREGGPCGVLAPIQALILKYLLFATDDETDTSVQNDHDKKTGAVAMDESYKEQVDPRLVFSDEKQTRALVRAMGETLWRAGSKKKAVIAVLDIPGFDAEYSTREDEQDEAIANALDGIVLDSPSEVQRFVRVCTVVSLSALHQQLQKLLPAFRSRMGALLLLFSALLSRSLDAIQADRDEQELDQQPLVAPPFGHAAQEIVNLLLCGQAVPHVFDGSMNLEGVMNLKGIPANVEVGFLTLMESLNLCKVGQHLKCPKWPIWVVGSESHYTVLFAFSTTVQDESDLEDRESVVRQAFDAHDKSGGGGYISPEDLQQVITDLKIEMPQDMLANLCSSDIVVWNDFWQALCQIDNSKGGLKAAPASLQRRQFELYHFNGMAKPFTNGAGDDVQPRPRLIKLTVVVPPKWTPDSHMEEQKPLVLVEVQKDLKGSVYSLPAQGGQEESGIQQNEPPAQHAPLVDCIRTRWQRATCYWSGDAPSIV